MNKRKAVCIERCTYSLVGGRWNRALGVPRQRPTQLQNRSRPRGWLPPSLRSRISNVLTWASRYCRWAPITRIDVERVRFDLHLLQNPEIAGVQYQRGELVGWE